MQIHTIVLKLFSFLIYFYTHIDKTEILVKNFLYDS